MVDPAAGQSDSLYFVKFNCDMDERFWCPALSLTVELALGWRGATFSYSISYYDQGAIVA